MALKGNQSDALGWVPAGGDGQTPTYAISVTTSSGTVVASATTALNSYLVTGLTKGVKYSFTITSSTAASVAGWIPSVTTKVKTFTAL